jgi:hypothetical protein
MHRRWPRGGFPLLRHKETHPLRPYRPITGDCVARLATPGRFHQAAYRPYSMLPWLRVPNTYRVHSTHSLHVTTKTRSGIGALWKLGAEKTNDLCISAIRSSSPLFLSMSTLHPGQGFSNSVIERSCLGLPTLDFTVSHGHY